MHLSKTLSLVIAPIIVASSLSLSLTSPAGAEDNAAAAKGITTALALSQDALKRPVGPGQPAPKTNSGDSRPNMVLISADDMRADEIRYMPRTKKLLGKAGITFNQALTPHPLCCPARAELLTGQFAQNNGVRTNWGPQGGYGPLDASETIATWLSSAGYNTAMVGKHLNSVKFEDGPEPGWTIFDPTLNGYSDYFDFTQYDNGKFTRVQKQYYTEYVGDKSVEAVRTLSAYDSPFYMWVSHFGPHSTQDKNAARGERKSAPTPAPSYTSNSTKVKNGERKARQYFRRVASKPSYKEADKSDKQKYLRKETSSKAQLKALMKGRIAALYSVDVEVSRVLRELDKTGELDNTYVAFITDNGYLLGEHDYVGKVLGFEEAFKTPLLVRGPGIEPGSTHGKPVSIVDLVPTWLDIADAEARIPLDGLSLLDLFEGGSGSIHPAGMLVQAGPVQHETEDTGWYYRGVRTERYTYLKFYDGWVELYDRSKDPHQIESVAKQAKYASVLKELDSRTEQLASCSGPAACNPNLGSLPKPRR